MQTLFFYLERVAFGVLQRALSNPASQTAANVGVERELAAVRRRLSAFQFIASFATLHGLLATFHGMAFTPHGCGSATSRAAMLAKGISESLSFTHAGLWVAAAALALAGLLTMLNRSFEAALRHDTQALLSMLRTHRDQLRLEVGEQTHRPAVQGPATYRSRAQPA